MGDTEELYRAVKMGEGRGPGERPGTCSLRELPGPHLSPLDSDCPPPQAGTEAPAPQHRFHTAWGDRGSGVAVPAVSRDSVSGRHPQAPAVAAPGQP